MQLLAPSLLLTLALTLAGCQAKEPPRLTVYPVSGKLLINGRAPEKAEVTFHPLSDYREPGKRSAVPHARVQADGTFKIGTYLDDDGAAAGEYAVTVSWPTVKIEGNEESFGPDQLNNRFATVQQPAAKITVKEGNNQLPPIELKSR